MSLFRGPLRICEKAIEVRLNKLCVVLDSNNAALWDRLMTKAVACFILQV